MDSNNVPQESLGSKRSFPSSAETRPPDPKRHSGAEPSSTNGVMPLVGGTPSAAIPASGAVTAAGGTLTAAIANGEKVGNGSSVRPAESNASGDGPSVGAASSTTVGSGGIGDSTESKAISKGKTDPDLVVLEVTNDGDPVNMELLIHLKEIFHQQLPKMPKEYIVRLVFDRKHRSIVLTKKGNPIGGITYRHFKEQKFGEIAFCAVASTSQVQGNGSRLMNELKLVAIRDGITHFHTYADNYAIGYFGKHGFTKNLTMSRDRWYLYVKDYDGGTHMECYVHPTVPYMNQSEMYQRQRDFLLDRIADMSVSTRVYPGLTEKDFADLKNHIDIPGVAEAGWTEEELKAQNRRKSDRDALATNKELLSIWREIERHDQAWPFRDAVDPVEVPDYYKMVARPMDLTIIRENLEELDPKPRYESKEAMREHMQLMIDNCKGYNAPDTEYWIAADGLEKFIAEVFSR